MQTLKFTSSQAPTADPTCRRLAHYLGQQMGQPTHFVEDVPWQAREQLLDAGEIQVGWICGLHYIARTERVALLAAPVMAAPRYRQRPLYYSDVIVRRDSPYQQFTDLRGATWAYNEPDSQSGCNVLRYYLARRLERGGFVGRMVEAGSHRAALDTVLSGEAEAAAIDSTVLDTELEARPSLQTALRVIEMLGPSPMPPWVVHRSVPPAKRQALRTALMGMHQTAPGREILRAGRLSHFVPVTDTDYDFIREMARVAAGVRW